MIVKFEAKHNDIDLALKNLPGIKVKKIVHVNELRERPISKLSDLERLIIK